MKPGLGELPSALGLIVDLPRTEAISAFVRGTPREAASARRLARTNGSEGTASDFLLSLNALTRAANSGLDVIAVIAEVFCCRDGTDLPVMADGKPGKVPIGFPLLKCS